MTLPSIAITLANGYSPSLMAARESSMHRRINARSVGSAIFWIGDTVPAHDQRGEIGDNARTCAARKARRRGGSVDDIVLPARSIAPADCTVNPLFQSKPS